MSIIRSSLAGLALMVLSSVSVTALGGADSPEAKPADGTAKAGAAPFDVRRPFRDLSPEERQARFKEMQERFGPAPFTLEEFRRMTPEERQLKLRQWREKGFTPAERQKRRLQIRERLGRQMAELKQKKGPLSDEERVRLERLELIAARFDRISRLGAPSNSPAAAPPANKGK